MTEDKKRFVEALAEYLVDDQAKKSMELEMGKPDAEMWAKMRNLTPLRGYPTVERAIHELTVWLWPCCAED